MIDTDVQIVMVKCLIWAIVWFAMSTYKDARRDWLASQETYLP